MKIMTESISALDALDMTANLSGPRDRRDIEAISEDKVRMELDCILQSSMFAQSARLSRFLRFVVESTLSDEGKTLKEYVIGVEVYDRKPPYHPNEDSIVRTEARRLRSKLKEYYESEGRWDPICIYLRTGSYVPVFRSKEALVPEAPFIKDNEAPDSSLQQRIQLLEEEKNSLTQLVVELACKNHALRRASGSSGTGTNDLNFVE